MLFLEGKKGEYLKEATVLNITVPWFKDALGFFASNVLFLKMSNAQENCTVNS